MYDSINTLELALNDRDFEYRLKRSEVVGTEMRDIVAEAPIVLTRHD